MRWTTPSVYKRRTASRDVELAGVPIAAGDKVTFWEMSANRDERVFADPFRFDVGRRPNPHLGFGWGAHFCLGASLARLEIRVMLELLVARGVRVERSGDIAWMPNNRLFGLKHLPVRLVPGEHTTDTPSTAWTDDRVATAPDDTIPWRGDPAEREQSSEEPGGQRLSAARRR